MVSFDAKAELNEFGLLAQSKEAFEQSPRGLSGEGAVEKETNLTSLDGSPSPELQLTAPIMRRRQ